MKGVIPRDEALGWREVQMRGLVMKQMCAGCRVRWGFPLRGSISVYSAETSSCGRLGLWTRQQAWEADHPILARPGGLPYPSGASHHSLGGLRSGTQAEAPSQAALAELRTYRVGVYQGSP